MKYIFVVIVTACPEHGPQPIGIFAYGFPSFSKLSCAPVASGPVFLGID
jgi:hypothetical protein